MIYLCECKILHNHRTMFKFNVRISKYDFKQSGKKLALSYPTVNRIKCIAAVLIALVVLGLQPATATMISGTTSGLFVGESQPSIYVRRRFVFGSNTCWLG